LADLVVLDNDPFAVDPMAIRDISVRATVVDGITEYEA
jgi:predicted amidohydrolase YtcJ